MTHITECPQARCTPFCGAGGADRVTLALPLLPPTVNHMYKAIGKGRKALTDEAVTWREEACVALRGLWVPAGPLACTVFLTFGRKAGRTRRVDADNRIKALADALALALGFDDSRIVEWHIYSQHGAADACTAWLEAAGTLRQAVVAALQTEEGTT